MSANPYASKRPTKDSGASIDAILCYPATTINEYIGYQMMDWEYNESEQMRYYTQCKREILEGLPTEDLRSMIKEKQINVDFNSTLINFSEKICNVLLLYTRNSIDLILESKDYIAYQEYMEGYMITIDTINKAYRRKINEPLLKCILTFNREIRNRTNANKESQIDLFDLKNRVPILDVINHYINIGRYKPKSLIKCPLPKHDDGSASFMIYENSNSYYCFGCHGKGTQIDFIIAMENCSIRDAIKKLNAY